MLANHSKIEKKKLIFVIEKGIGVCKGNI